MQKWLKRSCFITLSLLLCYILLSCRSAGPDNSPTLGEGIDANQINKMVSLAAPTSANTFKSGDVLLLEAKNLSSNTWEINLKEDLKIFKLENNEWYTVPETLEDVGNSKIILKPKGDYPDEDRLFFILPDVGSEEEVYLRIYLIVRPIDTVDPGQGGTAAYVEVQLEP